LTSGLALSVALHAGVLLVMPRAFAPDPVAEQPIPRSEMQVRTEAVAQSESSAIPPPADVTAASDTQGANLAQGVITQSRATAAPLVAPRLAAAAPPPDTAIAAASPPATAVTAAQPSTAPVTPAASPATTIAAEPPPATQVAAAPPPVASIAAAPPSATTLAASAPPAAQAAVTPPSAAPLTAAPPPVATVAAAPPPAQDLTAAPPPATTLPSPAPPSPALAPAAPTGQPLAQTTGTATALPEAQPDTDTITAELAFSGEGGVPLDPQALATIQSFMQAGDPGSTAAEARDALEALLSQVPCSRLQAEFDPDTGTIALRGHIPEEELRAPVLAALQAQVGQGIAVTDSMLILPRPQCGALAGIGGVGLPQSTDQTTDSRILGDDAHARVFSYRGGDMLVLGLESPDYDAHVYIDYFDASGNVIHLVPNDVVPLTLHPAGTAVVVGEAADGRRALEIMIGPPFGQEIAVAFAASKPLYDGLRPTVEEAGPYLQWLAARVAEARAADPAFKGEWVYFFVETRAE
jgi:hypothetical protein